jgi:hypothetical protein
MDYYIDSKSSKDMLMIVENIERHLLIDDYENAFIAFLLHIEKMNFVDRTDLIKRFRRYFTTKHSLDNIT